MRQADADRWATARTLADLGELTALYLEGELGESPTYHAPPNPETGPLIPLLAAVNRAGFVTHQSQPGVPFDEHGNMQRANVSGFASGTTFAQLMTVVADADLAITAARGLPEDWKPSVVITLFNGAECTWDGGQETTDELEYSYVGICHDDAVRALCGAWQVTLIDPVWGRNDLLWPLLEKFAGRTAGLVRRG